MPCTYHAGMGIPDVSEVRIGSGRVVLVFQGPPTAEHIGASVEGPFMTAGDSIVLDESLIAFFEDLDRSWRGWADTKTWVSAGRNLSLSARHDGVGRVVITVALVSPELSLGDLPTGEDDWSASAVVAMEAGASGGVAIRLRSVLDSEGLDEPRPRFGPG